MTLSNASNTGRIEDNLLKKPVATGYAWRFDLLIAGFDPHFDPQMPQEPSLSDCLKAASRRCAASALRSGSTCA